MVRGRESHWCNKPQVRHNVASSLSLQHLPHHRKLFPPPSIFVACTSHGAKRAAGLGVSPQGPVAPPPCSRGQTTKRAVQASGGTWCSVSGCMPIAHTDTAVTTSQGHLLKLAVAHPPPLHKTHTHTLASTLRHSNNTSRASRVWGRASHTNPSPTLEVWVVTSHTINVSTTNQAATHHREPWIRGAAWWVGRRCQLCRWLHPTRRG